MQWEPEEQAWFTYINFELRYKEIDRARAIYGRFLHVHGHIPQNWIRYSRFEERLGEITAARAAYERAIAYFEDGGENGSNLDESLLLAYAQFEERQGEPDRARAICQYGVDYLPEEGSQELQQGLRKYQPAITD